MAIKQYSNKNILNKLNEIEIKIDNNYDQDNLRFESQLNWNYIMVFISFFAIFLASLGFIYKNFAFLLLTITAFIGTIIFFIFAIVENVKLRKRKRKISKKP